MGGDDGFIIETMSILDEVFLSACLLVVIFFFLLCFACATQLRNAQFNQRMRLHLKKTQLYCVQLNVVCLLIKWVLF